MIYDLNKLNKEYQDENDYEVCIIGSGAAGITIAKHLSKFNLKIALIEGGSLDFSSESQDIYKGKLIGDPYYPLDVARLRYLGGSTNHWGGMSRSFDEVDFERGYFGEEFKWPIKYFRNFFCHIKVIIINIFNFKRICSYFFTNILTSKCHR